jgi:hypothetical protein
MASGVIARFGGCVCPYFRTARLWRVSKRPVGPWLQIRVPPAGSLQRVDLFSVAHVLTAPTHVG